MDNDRIKQHLKAMYPDVNAPDGFYTRVMINLRTDAVHVLPSDIASVLRRDLRPFIAIAACFILIVGVYFTGIFSPAAPSIVERAALEEILGDDLPQDMPIAEGDKYVNGEVPLPEVKPVDDVPLVQSEQEVDKVPVPMIVEAPVIKPFETVEKVTVPSGANGYVAASKASPSLEITPIAEKTPAFDFNNVEIPGASVYMRHSRVINSVTVNMSVRNINRTLPSLDQWERLQGVSPDIVITENRSDGALVMTRSYIMSDLYKSTFINYLNSLSTDIGVQRQSLDITEQYLRMLDRHRELIVNMSASDQQAHEINEIIADLIFIDKRSQEGVYNVVVWIEDGVDF